MSTLNGLRMGVENGLFGPYDVTDDVTQPLGPPNMLEVITPSYTFDLSPKSMTFNKSDLFFRFWGALGGYDVMMTS